MDEAGPRSLGQSVPEPDPDPDWTARFFDHAKDASNEDMQVLWAKILAGEVLEPGTFSLRTLDVVRNMTRADAEAFRKLVPFVVNNDALFRRLDGSLQADTLTLDELLQLQDCGVLSPNATISYNLDSDESELSFRDVIVRYTLGVGVPTTPRPVYILTSAGQQLLNVVEASADVTYVTAIFRLLKESGKNPTAHRGRRVGCSLVDIEETVLDLN